MITEQGLADMGFTEKTVFDGEYVLFLDPNTGSKVRVYDNGDTWLSIAGGEYFKIQPLVIIKDTPNDSHNF